MTAQPEAADERRRSVALHDDCVGLLLLDDGSQPLERPHGHVGERLTILEDVEIVGGRDAERFEDLVEHLPVLRSHHHNGLERRRLVEGTYNRSQLDGFGAGSEHDHDALHVATSIATSAVRAVFAHPRRPMTMRNTARQPANSHR